jgi:RHS repeat-associated protein
MVRTSSTTFQVVTDAIGSPRLAIDTASGAVSNRVSYDAFGNVRSQAGSPVHPFGFAGGLTDPETGLVMFGYRNYDPRTGRWLEPDPLGFAAGSPNVYQYAGGDPVNAVDPMGLASVVFYRNMEWLYVLDDAGKLVMSFPASNRVQNPTAHPLQADGFGPEPTGTFPIGNGGLCRNTTKFPSGSLPITGLPPGPDGRVRQGLLIHGDAETNPRCVANAKAGVRPLWQCGTQGCIRVDTAWMKVLCNYAAIDPIREITIRDHFQMQGWGEGG